MGGVSSRLPTTGMHMHMHTNTHTPADEAAAPLPRLDVEGAREVGEVVAGHHLRLVAA